MVAAGKATLDIVHIPLLGIEMGESAGPCRPRRWGRDPQDAPGTLGKLGGASAPGGAGRVRRIPARSGLGETVAVSGQVQLIQNVQHRGMLVEGEEVQTRCARIHHGTALVQCVVHADAVQLCATGCRLQGVARSAGTDMPAIWQRFCRRFSEVTGMMPGIIGISTPARCAESTRAL